MFEECKLIFLTDINKMTTEDKIPPEFMLNADQTPCSNLSIGRMMMAARNASSVSIKGVTDKRSITLTFVIRRILTHASHIPSENNQEVLNSPEDLQFPRIQNNTLMKVKL